MTEANHESNNKRIDEVVLSNLVPNKKAQNSELYCKLINDAVNHKEVFNIALTGGYGSGKSSIVETYLSKTKGQFKVIRISLANFNLKSFSDNKKTNNQDQSSVANKNARRSWSFGVNTDAGNESIQLEISLLQQFIFQSQYWEEKQNENLIGSLSKNLRIIISISLFIISIFSIQFLWNPYLLVKWISLSDVEYFSNSTFFNFCAFASLITTTFWFLYQLFWLIQGWTSAKIDIAPFSLELSSKNDQTSILNFYLYEIVKLFRDEQIKLVILEDIDRLEDQDLFEKLREINNILRYNPSTKQLNVTFLYSLKESVFQNEKDKNKFFDVIIPVIPFVNSSNSKSKLLESIQSSKIEVTDEMKSIISTASICIDEMRTILNISNDFKIYHFLLSQQDHFSSEKLLAIVIYKNLFPKDFEKVHIGASALDQLFGVEKNIVEYLMTKELMENESNLYRKKKEIEIEEKAKKLLGVPFIELFHTLELGTELKNFGFENAEKLESNYKLDFVQVMIENGHITQDYKEYVSHFYEGEYLNKNDKQFILRLRKNLPGKSEDDIDNVASVVDELFLEDWSRIGVLNEQIFNYAFENGLINKLENVFSTRKQNYIIMYDEFIRTYFDNTRYKLPFLRILEKSYPNFLFPHSTELESETYNTIFVRKAVTELLLIKDEGYLVELNKNKVISLLLDKDENLVDYMQGQMVSLDQKKALADNLKTLNIKFNHLSYGLEGMLMIVILNETLFTLTLKNISIILTNNAAYFRNGANDISITNLLTCQITPLRNYFGQNMINLIYNVCIPSSKFGKKWRESIVTFKEILGLDFSLEDKRTVITLIRTEKRHFEEYEDHEDLWEDLFTGSKIIENMENLHELVISTNVFSPPVVDTINSSIWLNQFDKNVDIIHVNNVNHRKVLEQMMVVELTRNTTEVVFGKINQKLDESYIFSQAHLVTLKHLIDLKKFNFSENVFAKFRQLFEKECLHLGYVLTYEVDFLTSEETWLYFALNEKEMNLLFSENISTDFVYQILKHYQTRIPLLSSENKTKAYNILMAKSGFPHLGIAVNLFPFLNLNQQILMFNKIVDSKENFSVQDYKTVLEKVVINSKKVSDTLLKHKLKENTQNKEFVQHLKNLQLINGSEIEKGEIVFRRNMN